MSQTQEEITSAQEADPIETLYAEALNLPGIPSGVHQFGAAIEQVKIMLSRITIATSELKEQAALIKARVSAEVRGDKATASEKDKKQIAELLACDEDLRIAEARWSNLMDAWVRWDARRSRLNRDFEVARIEHEFRRRLAAADYEANRRRNSS